VDVRVLCATHSDLQERIAAQAFREDLYYRLSEITLNIPPLRRRGGDAILLARSLLHRFNEEYDRPGLRFSAAALRAVEAWSWPGNVRELENRVKRAVIMAEGQHIEADDLEIESADDSLSDVTLRQARESAEREAIERALRLHEGNLTRAAHSLGVTRPTLYTLVSKHGLDVS